MRNIQQRGKNVHTFRMCCNRKRKSFNSREREKISTPRRKRIKKLQNFQSSIVS
jgi:hypothetical protein